MENSVSDSTYGGTLPPTTTTLLPPATTTLTPQQQHEAQPDQGLAFTGTNLLFVLVVALVAIAGGVALWYTGKHA